MKSRPPIPPKMKLELRQRAFFGCVCCGCPIIEYHHIIPWEEVQKHEIDNLVVLCPICHHRVHARDINGIVLSNSIARPFNSKSIIAKYPFSMGRFDKTIFEIGGNQFIRVPTLICVQNDPIITISKDNDGMALLNAHFYDSQGTLFAQIKNNEWYAYLDKDIWDLEYKPGNMRIHNKPRKIMLEVTTLDEVIVIKTLMYYRNAVIRFGIKDVLSMSTNSNKYVEINGLKIVDGKTGLNIGPDGSIRIGSEGGIITTIRNTALS